MNRHFLVGLLVAAVSLGGLGCDGSESGGGTPGDANDDSSSGGTGGEGGGSASPDGEGGQGGGEATSPCDEPPPASFVCDEGENYADCQDGDGYASWRCEPDTPLVLSFDGASVTYVDAPLAAFDLTGLGQSVASDWPAARTPWLALDRDRDGSIADGTELFGSAVRLASGKMASHGFEALAELDSNRDGRIDAGDARFAELVTWADADADRTTDAGELARASSGERRIVAIDLSYRVEPSCDERGNCAVERAAFTWADADGREHVGEVVDVHLHRRML